MYNLKLFYAQNTLHTSHADVLSSLLCHAAMEDVTSVLYRDQPGSETR